MRRNLKRVCEVAVAALVVSCARAPTPTAQLPKAITPAASPAANTVVSAGATTGWRIFHLVPAESEVRFEVKEEFLGIGLATAIGWTSVVTGQLELRLDNGALHIGANRFAADLRTLVNDEPGRDEPVRRTLNSDGHPFATLVLPATQTWPKTIVEGQPASFTAVADMNLLGITRTLPVTVEATLAGDTLNGMLTMVVSMAAFGIHLGLGDIIVNDAVTVRATFHAVEGSRAETVAVAPSRNVNGQVVFSYQEGGNTHLYIMNGDGTDHRQLTQGNVDDLTPAWSPDGERIVFARQEGDSLDIFVVNADGTGLAQLMDNGAPDTTPAWSPDGAQIAYAATRPGSGAINIHVMNADGSDDRQLTTGGRENEFPTWSPDGRRIAFSCEQPAPLFNADICVIDVDGSNVTQLTRTSAKETQPAWSPDGSKIAFSSNGSGGGGGGRYQIYLMNADGTNLVNLSDSPYEDQFPAWLPDGAGLSFIRRGAIHMMNADGSGVYRLTEATSYRHANWQIGTGPAKAPAAEQTRQSGAQSICPATQPGTVSKTSILTLGPSAGITPSTATGERLIVTGALYDAGCSPLVGARLEVWQTDANGEYGPGHGGNDMQCCYFMGAVAADQNGRFQLITIRPGHYKGESQPPLAHIHIRIDHPDVSGREVEFVFKDDPYLGSSTLPDTVIALDAVKAEDEAGAYWRATGEIVLRR